MAVKNKNIKSSADSSTIANILKERKEVKEVEDRGDEVIAYLYKEYRDTDADNLADNVLGTIETKYDDFTWDYYGAIWMDYNGDEYDDTYAVIIEKKDEEYLTNSKKLVNDVERQMDLEKEDIDPSNIYEYAVKLLPSEDIDHHGSDLYIRKTPESIALIDKMKYKDSGFLTTFRDNFEHDIWYDLPFCYPGIESGCHGKNKKEKNMKKTVKSGRFLKSAESYGWVVESSEAWEAYDMACDYLGKETVNQAIVDSMGTDELAESLAFLFRQWDFTEWDERNGEIESACHGKNKKKKTVKSGKSSMLWSKDYINSCRKHK